MNIRNKAIVVIVLGVVLISVLTFQLLKTNNQDENTNNNNEDVVSESRGVAGEPLDVALDFLQSWLQARTSTTTDPYQLGLASAKPLTLEVSEKLLSAEISFRDTKFDPVLCQSELPSSLRAKFIYANPADAQVMIFPRDRTTGIKTITTLKGRENFWEITDISCGTNEQGPDVGEFNFDREGFLLKSSVQPPLDSNYWHLVFEQDGVLGYTVPLYLGADSLCVNTTGNEEVCSDSVLMETMKVQVKGSLTEAGVTVKRIEVKQ